MTDLSPGIDPAHVTIKDDGLTEKYWDPEWGDEGAAPDGVSYLDPEGDDAPIVVPEAEEPEHIGEPPPVYYETAEPAGVEDDEVAP